ncbi:MAG TPA: hypothetical protein PLS48_01405 [Methanotrichaceae archaeon]|nr:hypothetical protein [Methanotrichaceae archaeon]
MATSMLYAAWTQFMMQSVYCVAGGYDRRGLGQEGLAFGSASLFLVCASAAIHEMAVLHISGGG